jgi:hypothetical protein
MKMNDLYGMMLIIWIVACIVAFIWILIQVIIEVVDFTSNPDLCWKQGTCQDSDDDWLLLIPIFVAGQ